MIKPLFHTTRPAAKPAVPAVSPLPSLYRQQRTLTAAKNVAVDPRIQRSIDQKQAMMGRRIARLQDEDKTAR
jgi:hypothetical protein